VSGLRATLTKESRVREHRAPSHVSQVEMTGLVKVSVSMFERLDPCYRAACLIAAAARPRTFLYRS
jgi:hypothetical protein